MPTVAEGRNLRDESAVLVLQSLNFELGAAVDQMTADQIAAKFAAMGLATDADRERFKMEFALSLPDESETDERLFLRTDEHTASTQSDPNA